MPEHFPSFRLVDTHCHLDLFPSTEAIKDEIVAHDICTIAVTNAPFLFEATATIAKSSPLILPALGLHPELVASHGVQLQQFRDLIPRTKYIGEIGLDYVTKDESHRQEQRRVFDTILGWCADARDRVLTVHSRRSAPDVIVAIGDSFPGTVILHWYSGTLRDLQKGIEFGYYFSVNPAMVHSKNGNRVIQEIPRDRVLTETDGPFARESGQPATPSSVSKVIRTLAAHWDCSTSEAESLVKRNAECALFDVTPT